MDKPVWTNGDDRQLSELVNKFAPQGVPRLKADVQQLNAAIADAATPEGADALRRSFWQTHTPMQDGDAQRVKNLHKKACAARLIESDEVRTLNEALQRGLIKESEHRARVDSISSHVLTQVRRRALDLIEVMAETSAHETFGAIASAEEKRRVIERFNAGDAWNQALTRFKEVYDAADPARRGELKRDYPELAQSIGV